MNQHAQNHHANKSLFPFERRRGEKGGGGGPHQHGDVGKGQLPLPTVVDLGHQRHRRDPHSPLLLTTAVLHHPPTEGPHHSDSKQCRDARHEKAEAKKGTFYLGPLDVASVPAGGLWLVAALDGAAPAGVTIVSGGERPPEGTTGNPAMVGWEEEMACKITTGMAEDGVRGW